MEEGSVGSPLLLVELNKEEAIREPIDVFQLS
jgi:hypothetical protein